VADTLVEIRSCCGEGLCPHAELSRLSDPDDPVEQRVEEAGRSVACTCPTLDQDRLRACFGRLFDIDGDCRLFRRFQSAYHAERERLAE